MIATALSTVVSRGVVLAPWNHAALSLLRDRGHVAVEAVYQANGRLARSKLWRVTDAGRAWYQGK